VPRIDPAAVLAQLDLEEKASLLSGSGFWHTRAVERLGIPSIMVADGPHGLRKQPGAGDHVGAGDSVPATCFPTAAALGSSFDVDLVRRVGEAIGQEARAQGVAVVLGPGINIKRTPLCGRNFEYLSEDPLVSGVLGAALVDGVQSQGVGTSLKHFAVNNQETDRLRVSAVVDERTLREIYLAGFEHVVRTARPWTVMCSYNRVNGVYASEDPWLLTTVLRDEWQFDGLVVSDWGAVDDPVAAVAAGLDLEMPSSHGGGPTRVTAAVGSGALDESVVDRAVERLLQLLDRVAPGTWAGDGFDEDGHHELARSVAAECAVLLTNDHGLLPLRDDLTRVAVVGEFARSPRFQGAGSSKVSPTRVDDALSALHGRLGEIVQIEFAPGFGVDDPEADEDALRTEAVELAAGADVVLVFLGLPPSFESEGFDRDRMDLPDEQIRLLEAVGGVTDRVVVVLANGGAVTTAPWQHHAGAILEGWLGGQAGGGAIVDVLVGDVDPSGRLAETIPVRLVDTPAFPTFPGRDSEVVYGEGVFVGYRYYDLVDRPVSFPFGHGLSYTTFEYSDLEVDVVNVVGDPDPSADWRGPARITASVRVTNTGERAGKDVVQLYVGAPDTPRPRTVRELRGFAKVALAPGESREVSFTLTERDLSQWSTRAHDWVLEPGRFAVSVGASSRDIRCTAVVTVEGPRPVLPLGRNSTLAEWLDHPVGRGTIEEALRSAPGGDMTPLLADPETLRMLGSFPLTRLVVMLGDAMGDRLVDRLLAEVTGGSE
jgi:beta-glucosidase